MAEQGPPPDRMGNYATLEGANLLARLLGLIIVGMALAVSSKAANIADDNEVWVFLSTLVTPMALGFLILVGAESMSRLSRR
ncbi:MAG: hypothetical protein BZY88_06005 [SAR202 cluster bacterium Io17-Chloro-G9]|nr:MAG: hypothetical protein BZY88_06005 [SAR202 cluster bacterium Io17-Chloro-G9]